MSRGASQHHDARTEGQPPEFYEHVTPQSTAETLGPELVYDYMIVLRSTKADKWLLV
jgi:hypothetical protein